MNDETPSTGKMWADICIFLVCLIPILSAAICFGLAGIGFIMYDMTPMVERLMTVGGIMGFIGFILCFGGLMNPANITIDDDEREDED